MVPKSSLIMVPKSSLVVVLESSLIMVRKGSLIMVSKIPLIKYPKSTKSSLINKYLHTYKTFWIIITIKSTLKIRAIKKIKSKFTATQLKSAKSPLQLSTQSLKLVYRIIHNGDIRFKNLATFAVKLLKCV